MKLRPLLKILSLLLLSIYGAYFNIAMAKEVMLKEKIGQMLIIGFKGTELKADDAIVKAILKQNIGGVILFDYDFQNKSYDHNIKNKAQLKHLTQQLQDYANKAAIINKNNLTPLFISIDNEGGKVNRLKENYGFPQTISAAAIGQMSYIDARKYAEQMAATLKEEGININFAPVTDVNINSDNPIIGKLERSFSKDPQKVVNYAAIFTQAFLDQGVLCTYKHFPGHGSSVSDTHQGFVDVTNTWREDELIPYVHLFKQMHITDETYHYNGCPLVMTGHVVHRGLDEKGYPASLSNAITQKLLREKLNFKGIVVTDDLQMKAIADHYNLEERVRLAVNAGADLLIFGNQLVAKPQDPNEIVDIIYRDVSSGRISEKRIDESYQRISKLKEKLRKIFNVKN